MGLREKDGIAISINLGEVASAWDISTGSQKASFHIPAQDSRARDALLIDNKSFFFLAHTLEDPHLGCRGEKNPLDSGRTTPPPRTASQDIGGWAKAFLLSEKFIQV